MPPFISAVWLFLQSTTGKLIIAASVSALVAGSASMWATGIYYRSDIAQLKLAAAQAHDANSTEALKQFQDATSKISLAAGNYELIQKNMTTSFDVIIKDFKNVKFKAPLPVDCKPDNERLRVLTAAVTAANQTATAGQ